MTKAMAPVSHRTAPGTGVPLHAHDSGYFAALLPAGVSVVETRALAPVDSLLAEERAVVACAVSKRALEFATGRWCAREAIARMGIHGFPLLPDAGRAPVWPCNIVGSITHTEGFCAAVVGRRDCFLGIGIDAETDGRAGIELWSTLFTTEEIHWLERLPSQQRSAMATLLFSAKESFYKAQYSLTSAWLGFQSATVSVERDSWNLKLLRPQGVLSRLQSPVSGRFAIRDRLVLTAIAIETIQLTSP